MKFPFKIVRTSKEESREAEQESRIADLEAQVRRLQDATTLYRYPRFRVFGLGPTPYSLKEVMELVLKEMDVNLEMSPATQSKPILLPKKPLQMPPTDTPKPSGEPPQ